VAGARGGWGPARVGDGGRSNPMRSGVGVGGGRPRVRIRVTLSTTGPS
jgi:hypothetical protein